VLLEDSDPGLLEEQAKQSGPAIDSYSIQAIFFEGKNF
jgi:hypothetical protein